MSQDASTGVLAHWSTLLESFNTSPLEFYSSVERAIQQRGVPETQTSRVDYSEGGILSARREYLRVTRGKLVFDICGAPFGTGFFVSSWLSEPRSSVGLLYLIGIVGGFFALSFFALVFVANVIGVGAATVLAIIGFPAAIFVGLPLLFFVVGSMAKNNSGMSDVLLSIPLVGALYERLFHPVTYYKLDTALMFQKAVHNAVMQAIDEMTNAKGFRALSELERKPLLIGLSEK